MTSASAPSLCVALIASNTTCKLVFFESCRYFSNRFLTPALTYTAEVGFARVRGLPGLRTADTGRLDATGAAGAGDIADSGTAVTAGRSDTGATGGTSSMSPARPAPRSIGAV